MFAGSRDEGWQRLRKTVDLTGKTTGDLKFKVSWDTEDQYDFVVVEAHTVGQDDWTTLEEANGGTEANVGASCDINWDTLHPFLTHYQTNIDKSEDAGDEDCTPDGTTGTPPGHWFGATGNSSGFQDWEFDLSAYAGSQVEVSISYIQDFASDGLGVFVDDASVTTDGRSTESTDFESGNGGWTAGPAPDGSANDAQWTNRTSVGYKDGPGVATDDTLYFGFGFEGIRTAARAERRHGRRDALPGRAQEARWRWPRRRWWARWGPAADVDYSLRISKRTLRVDRKRRTKVRLSCGPTNGHAVQGRRAAHAQEDGDGPAVVQHHGQQDPVGHGPDQEVGLPAPDAQEAHQDDDHAGHPRL